MIGLKFKMLCDAGNEFMSLLIIFWVSIVISVSCSLETEAFLIKSPVTNIECKTDGKKKKVYCMVSCLLLGNVYLLILTACRV